MPVGLCTSWYVLAEAASFNPTTPTFIQALDNRGKSVYDPDELDEEENERRRRKLCNSLFKKFVEQVHRCVGAVCSCTVVGALAQPKGTFCT